MELTTIATLCAQIGLAERELHELQAEQAALPERIQQAAFIGDVDAQIHGERRLAELPLWIRARAMNVERLHVERIELLIEEAKAEEERLLPDVLPAEERAEKAILERNRIRSVYRGACARTKDLNLDKLEHTRRLQALGGESKARAQHLAPAA